MRAVLGYAHTSVSFARVRKQRHHADELEPAHSPMTLTHIPGGGVRRGPWRPCVSPWEKVAQRGAGRGVMAEGMDGSDTIITRRSYSRMTKQNRQSIHSDGALRNVKSLGFILYVTHVRWTRCQWVVLQYSFGGSAGLVLEALRFGGRHGRHGRDSRRFQSTTKVKTTQEVYVTRPRRAARAARHV